VEQFVYIMREFRNPEKNEKFVSKEVDWGKVAKLNANRGRDYTGARGEKAGLGWTMRNRNGAIIGTIDSNKCIFDCDGQRIGLVDGGNV